MSVRPLPVVAFALASSIAVASPATAPQVQTFAVVASATHGPNSGPHTAKFVVHNGLGVTISVWPSCAATGPVTCGTVTPSSFNLAAGTFDTVSVTYSTGNPGTGSLTLDAYHSEDAPPNPASATMTVGVTGPPAVTLQVPAGTTRAVVATRQPIIRAFFESVGGGGVVPPKPCSSGAAVR